MYEELKPDERSLEAQCPNFIWRCHRKYRLLQGYDTMYKKHHKDDSATTRGGKSVTKLAAAKPVDDTKFLSGYDNLPLHNKAGNDDLL